MVDSVRDYILENQPKELADFATGANSARLACFLSVLSTSTSYYLGGLLYANTHHQCPPRQSSAHTTRTGGLDVKFSDDALAGAWQLCSSAADEFSGSNEVFRRAVALARMAIDPLGVLAACAGRLNAPFFLVVWSCTNAREDC